MNSKKVFLALTASTFISAAAANAAGIDMNDPRRALGREDDVRIDAQLVSDVVSPGTPIGITYQIQNLTNAAVAIADKVTDASYDEDSRTITVSIGSEVPADGAMPRMITIAPGEKKILRAAATPAFPATAVRTAFAVVPRYVQVRVTILRDLAPFLALIEKPSRRRLSDQLFNQFLENSDTIMLNTLPVSWSPRGALAGVDAEQRSTSRARGY